jgi:hypothetical protein
MVRSHSDPAHSTRLLERNRTSLALLAAFSSNSRLLVILRFLRQRTFSPLDDIRPRWLGAALLIGGLGVSIMMLWFGFTELAAGRAWRAIGPLSMGYLFAAVAIAPRPGESPNWVTVSINAMTPVFLVTLATHVIGQIFDH